jgi:large subunit ribosomal protein L22
MQVTAKLNLLRIAPRKVRLVADVVRGKTAEEAQQILTFTNKKAVGPMLKLLNSALASAKASQLEFNNLYISKVTVDEGPKYKRFRPRARGQAYEIQKKTSHILIVLSEITAGVKKAVSKETVQAQKEEKAVEIKEKSSKETIKPKFDKAVTAKPKTEKGFQKVFRRKVI